MDQEKKLRKHSWKEINKLIEVDQLRDLPLIFYTHYALRGGNSNHGIHCGAFFVYTSASFSYSFWYYGAALSFKPSTHYPRRGGTSSTGVSCGAFFIGASDSSSWAYWSGGAALSFKPNTHYTVRGGNSSNGSYCGIFYGNVSANFSYSNWRTGAALSFRLDKIHIMFFVVVFLTMVPIVVFSVFLLQLVLLIPGGALSLLYNKNNSRRPAKSSTIITEKERIE